MFKEIFRKIKETTGLSLLDQGQIAEGVEMLQNEVIKKDDPDTFSLVYALAMAYQINIGAGTEARKYYLKAWKYAQILISKGKLDRTDSRVMWTIHNNAQYSLSHEEYLNWCTQMKRSFPQAPLIFGVKNQYSWVSDLIRYQWSWADIMMEKAVAYSSPSNMQNMKRKRTAYSCAASIYQLMLDNKDKLEMSDSLYEICRMDYDANLSHILSELKATYPEPAIRQTCNWISGIRFSVMPGSTLNSFLNFTIKKKNLQELIQEQTSFTDNFLNLIEAGYYKTAAAVFKEYDIELANTDKYLQEDLKDKEVSLIYKNTRLLGLYNLASMYWTNVGLGENAMECYDSMWDALLCNHTPRTFCAQWDKSIALACENAILLSITPEEFIKWRNRLKDVAPNTKIINEIGKTFIKAHEDGKKWWEIISQLFPGFYNRNEPEMDRQRYGNAASLFRRMLIERKKLRLPTEIYKHFVMEYGILCLRMCAQDARKFSSGSQNLQSLLDTLPIQFYPVAKSVFHEIAWPVETALPFVEEYVKQYPGDEVETIVLKDMKTLIEEL